jgi:hypothetical protein
MDDFLIWDTVSMAWTEIGLDEDDYESVFCWRSSCRAVTSVI